MQNKSFNMPDETRAPSPKTKIAVVKFGDTELLHTTFEPGWKWSTDIKPVAGTESCQVHHLLCATSGRLMVVMDDGSTEIEIGPGDVADITAGHDAWVIGDEPFVAFDVAGVKS